MPRLCVATRGRATSPVVAVADHGMIQDLAGRLQWSFHSLRNLPFHFAGLEFFFGDTARLA